MEIVTEKLQKKGTNEKIIRHKLHHQRVVWMHFINFFLGVWLITSPSVFDYQNAQIVLNDIICGILISLFSLLSLDPFRLWAPWGTATVGLWLNVAPLVFWAPDAVVYNNDTITGILVMAFSIIAPGVPGTRLYEEKGPAIPPGWSYNPSSWIQRAPIIALGWIGFFSARYLAVYQLGYIGNAWDPFFGKGTENVLNSDISKAWPVSDAGLGAFSYMLDAMMGYIGGESRWRTLPWAVILFGILIIPLGAISITLIILQPVAVGSWCSVCLFTAVVMLIMIPCTFDEVFASVRFLNVSRKEGKSLWQVFWFGGSTREKSIAFESYDFSVPVTQTFKTMFSGFVIPWNLVVTSLTGIWLMFSPTVLGYGNNMSDNDHLCGALLVTFSVIAMGEIVRAFRFILLPLGLWTMAAPFLLEGSTEIAMYNGLICGGLIIALCFRKGKIMSRYGSFEKYIR